VYDSSDSLIGRFLHCIYFINLAFLETFAAWLSGLFDLEILATHNYSLISLNLV
jgi:hypothetical protein